MEWLRRLFFLKRKQNKTIIKPDEFIILSVLAKEGNQFASYELLQAILAAGMQFGDMNIFHYYDPNAQGSKDPLFSLASATKPGHFDLQKIGEFSCPGLTLFMNVSKVRDPATSFTIMLSVAEELAEELDGELYSAPGVPWGPEKVEEYQKKISLSMI